MGTRRFNLIEVAVVGSLPPNLQMLAAFDYSGVQPPAGMRVIGATWGSLGTVWSGRGIQAGAIRYAAGAVAPVNLLPVAAVVGDVSVDEGADRLKDTFTRADVVASLGVPDIGPQWSALTGTWGISNNQAYRSIDGNDTYAIMESGLSDGRVETVYSVAAGTQRLVFRCTDANNLWLVTNQGGSWLLYKRVAGVYTQVGSAYAGTAANGDYISVILNGSSIQVYINGNLAISASDSFNQTATKHGLGSDAAGNTSARWDNFRVIEVSRV